jgi:polyisoprenyl-teichoic acid--peptidoglycan teichoic acid transferase
MKLRSRLLQLLGIVTALAGLTGFWLTRDVEKAVYTEETLSLINAGEEDFRASFVVAGRDYDHIQEASPCQWRNGECYRERVGEFVYAKRTDTILYVQVVNDKVTMINLPRDIYLPNWDTKVNAMYFYQGAEGLKKTVEEIVGVPIDYYAIINIDIFQDIVDELGGVEVNIPYDMYYRDAAAGLEINFKEGPTRLNGEDAAKFVRYRHTGRGDYDRIDNLKSLAYAMLNRLKEMNVAAAPKIPGLIDAVFANLETNATPALIRKMLPRISRLQLQAATLPTYNVEGTNNERYDPEEVANFLTTTFGGEAKKFIIPPDMTLLITNRSGKDGLEERYKDRLVGMGVSEENIVMRSGTIDPTPTRILALTQSWQDADYYTQLFEIGKQQKDNFEEVEGKQVLLELVLGTDAAQNAIALDEVRLQSQR